MTSESSYRRCLVTSCRIFKCERCHSIDAEKVHHFRISIPIIILFLYRKQVNFQVKRDHSAARFPDEIKPTFRIASGRFPLSAKNIHDQPASCGRTHNFFTSLLAFYVCVYVFTCRHTLTTFKCFLNVFLTQEDITLNCISKKFTGSVGLQFRIGLHAKHTIELHMYIFAYNGGLPAYSFRF